MEEKVINGTLGVDKKQLIALLGSTMYKTNMQDVAIKELVQNAFDALKIARSLNSEHKGVLYVKLNDNERVITVRDNGIGMSTDIVQKAFFTIGGSYKGDNVDNRLKSGGLGLAKMAFLFGSEWVEVNTVKDGVCTYVKATSKEIMGDDFSINVTHTDKPNGTEVSVCIPEYYVDDDGNKKYISFNDNLRWTFLQHPILADGISLLEVDNYKEKEIQLSSTPEGYLYIGKATSAFGDIEMFIKEYNCYSSCYLNYDVYNSGLYQFKDNVYLDGTKSEVHVIINILPTVGVKSPLYPINNQREGFRATVKEEVRDLEYLVKRINNAVSKGKYAQAFRKCVSMDVRELSTEKRKPSTINIVKEIISNVRRVFAPEKTANVQSNTISLTAVHIARSSEEKSRKSTLDTSGIDLPNSEVTVDTSSLSLDKPVFHNNTNMTVSTECQKVLDEFGALILELKELYCQTHNMEVDGRERVKEQYWGISFDKSYGGINVKPSLFNFLAVNPFYHGVPVEEGVDGALYLMQCITHVIIHEFNHNYISYEGRDFTGKLASTEAEFVCIGELYNKWKKKLYTLISNNFELFLEYHKLYASSTNVGESLEQD